MSISRKRDSFEATLASLRGAVPDTEEYNRLSTIFLDDPLAERMRTMDPFTAEYRSTAMELYLTLRGRRPDGYKPEIDELTGGSGLPADIWRHSSPWSFRSPSMAAEFLICWGHIMRLLDLPADSTASILEYGPGSGQLLLLLARMGLDVHAVDIDQPSIDLVSAQASAMGLNVKCERALFGEGFEGKKFDRIIFFEAFHHAWDFENLLDRLANRLNPDGLLILCGEPVVSGPGPAIPFSWGPRMDGLSVFCMRHFGWMELGFTEDFFMEAFNRRGWLISDHHIAGFGRASAYVARRAARTKIRVGEPTAIGHRFSSGWEAPEGTHRWTKGGIAQFPNPFRNDQVDVIIRFSNMLAVKKNVILKSGDAVVRTKVPAGAANCEMRLRNANGSTIDLECEGHRPVDINFGSSDTRNLGIAVSEIEFTGSSG
jgi:2-polyprenyl-3-methyl-5-hydroxy-6-metoxy-1,4-benzoquinol methylase